MSGIKQVLEVHPPSLLAMENHRVERFETQEFVCPVCSGKGGSYINEHEIDGDRFKPCHMCKGTGKVKGAVSTKWMPAGKVKIEFRTKKERNIR